MAGYDDQDLEDEFRLTESLEGYRCAWNVFPSTRLNAQRLFIPLGSLYTPLTRSEDMTRVEEEITKCVQCGAVMNPYCNTDQTGWVCCMCSTRNALPHQYSHMTLDTLPLPLQEQFTTLEYQPSQEPLYPPTFLFVIDTCIIEEELSGIISTINQLFSSIPENIVEQIMCGIITFGRHVALYEIGYEGLCNKKIMFRGDSVEKHPTMDEIKGQLNVTLNDYDRFFRSGTDCETLFAEVLGTLKQDTWPRVRQRRKARCTGAAVQVACALLESVAKEQSARVMVFSGGAATCGPGQVVSMDMSKHIRSHKDILKGKIEYMPKAKAFYKDLANRAAANTHVIDLFGCALDQIGMAEQRVLVDNTGGTLILSDTFTGNGFSDSFSKIFSTNAYDELQMCFSAKIEVITSPELKVCGCVGTVTPMEKTNPAVVAELTHGIGKTNKWSIGGLYRDSTLAFYYDVTNTSDKRNMNDKFGYIQYVTSYRDASGYSIVRTTTLAVPFASTENKVGMEKITSGFDEDAAAVLVARLITFKAENEYDLNIINWLDRILIKAMSKCATYQPNVPESFRLPENFKYFPQFMFYLRRSQFVRVFGYSPDETSFYRHWLCRTSCENCMTMIRPTLSMYNLDNYTEPQEVPVDVQSKASDVILILDTFFHVVKWTGNTVVEWRDQNYREEEEYAYIGEFLDVAEEEMVERSNSRFPYPTTVRCDEGSSQERFLLARLNPSIKGDKNTGQGQGGLWTDDVNLEMFNHHLRKLASAVS